VKDNGAEPFIRSPSLPVSDRYHNRYQSPPPPCKETTPPYTNHPTLCETPGLSGSRPARISSAPPSSDWQPKALRRQPRPMKRYPHSAHACPSQCHLRVQSKRRSITPASIVTGKLRDESSRLFSSLSPCEACARGKMDLLPASKKALTRYAEPGKRLQVNIWGPSPFPEREGKKYVLGIIDDASRFLFTYPMNHRSDAPDLVNNLVLQVKNEKGPVLRLRRDGAKKLVGQSLSSFLTDQGIRDETTTPYAHEQNGIIERSWRTIFNIARTVLLRSSLPSNSGSTPLHTPRIRTTDSPTPPITTNRRTRSTSATCKWESQDERGGEC
jgi:transposase InsO family protein